MPQRELRPGDQEQVACNNREPHRARRRTPKASSSPRAAHSQAGASTPQERHTEVLLQPARPQTLRHRRRPRPSFRQTIKYAKSSTTTAAVSPREQRSRCTSTATKVGERTSRRDCPDGLLRRRDCRRRPRRRYGRQRPVPDRVRTSSPARCTGCRSTSTEEPTTSTTSSRPRNAGRSQWHVEVEVAVPRSRPAGW